MKWVWSSFGHCHPSIMFAGGGGLSGPKMAKHGMLADVPKCKRAQNCPKWSTFLTFGNILGPFGNFRTISDKTWFFAPKHFGQEALCVLRQNIKFFFWNDPRFQMVHKWFQMTKIMWSVGIILTLLDHFRTSASVPCFVPWLKDGQNCFNPTLYMSLDYTCATDSQIKHMYGWINCTIF